MEIGEEHKKRKVFWGVLILLFGFVWYLKQTNVIVLEPFWPIVVMIFGLIVILKGLLFKPGKR